MREKRRVQAVCLVMLAGALLALGLYQVHGRHQVIRIGYELSEARATSLELVEEQNRLRLEESVLTNPARIERLADFLGMVRPKPDQLKVVRQSPPMTALRRQQR